MYYVGRRSTLTTRDSNGFCLEVLYKLFQKKNLCASPDIEKETQQGLD